MAKTDDAITPARLRADGWTRDRADNVIWWIDLDARRTLFFSTNSMGVNFLHHSCVEIRTVTGIADLRSLVKALTGGE